MRELDLIDKKTLQKLQDVYTETLSLYGVCYSRSFEGITAFSGDEAAEEFFSRSVSSEDRKLLIASFTDGGIEDIIEGETAERYTRVMGVAIRDEDGRFVAVWLLFGICKDLLPSSAKGVPERQIGSEAFTDAVSVVARLSGIYFAERAGMLRSIAEAKKKKEEEEKEPEGDLHSEVLTQLFSFISSDQEFSGIVDHVLGTVGEHLKISAACLLKEDPEDTDRVDMICEWKDVLQRESLTPVFTGISKEELPFFDNKTYTISSESILPERFRSFFHANSISAGVFLPIKYNDKAPMYLMFLMIDEVKNWDVPELRFLNDVMRILESVYTIRMSQSSLAGAYATLDSVLEHCGRAVCVTRLDSRKILFENGMFSDFFADTKDRQQFEDLIFSTEDIIEHLEENREYYIEQAKRYVRVEVSQINWVDSRQVLLLTIADISETKQLGRRIKEQATMDSLTGLYNRQRFMRDFDTEIKDAVRSEDSGAMLYLNLDDFKDINGGLGHRFGDALLKEAASALLAIIKTKGTCYRLGGDEFAVLVPFHEKDSVEKLVDVICRRFEQPWSLDHTDYYCTMSMGVVTFPKDGTDVEVLLSHALAALASAKQSGRGRAEYYKEQENPVDEKRLHMERAMRRAVEDGCREFEVYYQPLMDASKPDRPCIGAEALVRWNSKDLGFVRPDDFIPMAEYTGMIVPIGTHVLYEACRHCKRWNDFGHPEFEININLSVVQLMQEDIVEVVEKTVNKSGIDPRNMILEITETVAIRDMEWMADVLRKLRAMGIRISLDDFGTGYSSLNRLKDLPLDEIKIDKSFVDDLTRNDFSGKFVETVSNLADTIDLNVVVEGVEEEAQASELDHMNVDLFQGYLFDKPLSEEDFEKKYMQ